MGRIPDQDRLAVVDGHLGHYQQAENEAGPGFEITPGYGQPQLQADRDAYHALQEDIAQKDADVQFKRAQRDDTFGTSGDDEDGVWFRLKQYKAMVRVRLGP